MTKHSIVLITMPVVAVNCPSISLTQLKDVTKRAHGDRVDVKILYLSHEFARYMAEGQAPADRGTELDLYEIFCGNQLHNTGLGDWFFRPIAFPDLPDNTDRYFARYFPGRSAQNERFKAALLERRAGVAAFLDSLIERHRIHEADIVGFTSMFQQNVATFAMARRLKNKRQDVTIVMGGANCEAPMGGALIRNVDTIDYVFSGPALISFPEFVGRRLAGDPNGHRGIAGVLGRGDGHDAAACAQMGAELPIDAEVDLDYSDFFESIERVYPDQSIAPVIFFETSRGCWWGERSHCTFCGLNGQTMAYRAMQPDNAVRLIQGLIDRYSDRSTYFFCVDNILPTNYLKEVLPRIEAPHDATIFYEVKANLGDDEIRALKGCGVKKIQPGIESLASSTLKLMKKGSTSFVNVKLLKSCVKHGVKPQWNLLIGFPGEGEDVYEKYVADLHRLTHLYPPDGAFPVRFDRYSPYFTKANEYGLKLRHLDYYRLTYPFDDATLGQMAYFFTDTNFAAPYIQSMVKWLSPIREKAQAWLGRWNDTHGALAPRLFLERGEGGGVVHDTRTGTLIEHPVSARQVHLLEHLESPRPVESLHKDFGAEIADDLAALDERGLLWREGDRCMSVVVLGEYAMPTNA